MDRIYNSLEKIDARLNNIEVQLAKYNAELEYHIVRTDELQNKVISFDDEMKPVRQHVVQVNAVAKILGILAVIATIVRGLAIFWGK